MSETLLFRHFGTKSGLFEATMLRTFRAGIEEHLAYWDEQVIPSGAENEHARKFLVGILDLFRTQRGVIFAIMNLDPDDEDVRSIQIAALESFDELVAGVQRHVLSRADGTSYDGLDERVSAPSVTGVLLSVTVLDEWLFQPGGCQPTAAELDDEVVAYVLDGVGHRP